MRLAAGLFFCSCIISNLIPNPLVPSPRIFLEQIKCFDLSVLSLWNDGCITSFLPRVAYIWILIVGPGRYRPYFCLFSFLLFLFQRRVQEPLILADVIMWTAPYVFFLSVSCVLNWGGPSAQIFLCVFYRGRPVENTSGNGCQKTPQVASGGGQPVTCDSVSLLFFLA